MEIKDKIIQGATEQFMLYGVKSVTMDDIANALGMSKRTIYEHFTNKKELLMDVVDYVHAQQDIEEKKMTANAETIIDEFFHLFASLDERYQRMGKFTFEVAKFFPEIYEEKYSAYHEKAIERLKGRLLKGIDQGVIIPNLNLEFTTYMMLEMIYNVISRRKRIVQMHIPLHDAFRYTIIHLLRGFSTDKGIHIIDEKSLNWRMNTI